MVQVHGSPFLPGLSPWLPNGQLSPLPRRVSLASVGHTPCVSGVQISSPKDHDQTRLVLHSGDLM